MELWKAVIGFESLYEVSDQGRVRSLMKPGRREPSGPALREKPLVMIPRPLPSGHLRASLGRDSEQQIHRMVLESFVGPCPESFEASHLNGDPTDNRLENLVWESRKNNFARKVEHGTHNRREKHPLAKLCQADVNTIKMMWMSGNRQIDIAAQFGVGPHAISRIVNGKRWNWASASTASFSS